MEPLTGNPKRSPAVLGVDIPARWTHLGALYVVVQVVPEGVDEVDGVVSGIGIGVTREQDWKTDQSTSTLVNYWSKRMDAVLVDVLRVFVLFFFYQRWCIQCCPRRRRLCPSVPAGAPCGWTAPGGPCGWLAGPPWTPTVTRMRTMNRSPARLAQTHGDAAPPRTCMKTLPMMTSSSSLNTVLKTTVTLSFLASTYLRVPHIKEIRVGI